LVFTELALQRTIIYGNLDARLQTNLLETLLAVLQNPCIIVEELMFQSFANHTVCA
jgi:hypothetical protein